ncbi:hypothetical protein AB4428_19090 [Vibrio lentus]
MYDKIIAINTEGLDKQDILQFISNFSQLLYSGQGSSNQFSKQLGVKETDGLRVLLGVPDTWMTTERQQIIEAIYAYTFSLPFGAHPEIWTNAPSWSYPNIDAITSKADMDNSVLDFDYLESFGIRMGQWEKEVLKANLTSYKVKANSGDSLGVNNFRLFMALVLFGFPNPYDFFVAK